MNIVLRSTLSVVCVWFIWINVIVNADNQCAKREIPGESVVCVCNETYCDDIVKEWAMIGCYVAYTSSKDGARFDKYSGKFNKRSKDKYDLSVELFPEECCQTIEGFGGSVTDAAGYNWVTLPKKLKAYLIESYFGCKGLEYNMIRVPIGGSDFSTRGYAYNEAPIDDFKLCNYSLSAEDFMYKLPFIKSAMKVATSPIHVIGSVWCPAPWMKTNGNLLGKGFLRSDCYQTYADYHYKFIELYDEEGVPVWGITTTNEPISGFLTKGVINCLGWVPGELGKFIAKYLGPTIKKSKYNSVKIMTGDDQRFLLPLWFNQLIEDEPKALSYVDGIATHWYGNSLTPPSQYKYVQRKHKDKFIISTEACEGFKTNDVILGSWQRAANYISDIITVLNNNVVGWIDWNLCLDPCGGPNWVKNYVDSPIIVFKDKNEFVKQPMFYAMGHFSKFIPRGSKRIEIDRTKDEDVQVLAVRTPDETIVVVVHNKCDEKRTITIKIGRKEINGCIEGNAVTTIEFPFTYPCFGIRKGCVRPKKQPCAPDCTCYQCSC